MQSLHTPKQREITTVKQLRNDLVIWLEYVWSDCVRQRKNVGQEEFWTHLVTLPKTCSLLLKGTLFKSHQPIVILIIIITLKIFKADISLSCP